MSNNPFDFSSMFTQFDPASAMQNQMQKMFNQYKLPNIDMKSILETQQKNMDAVTAANRAAVEGMQELMKFQSKIIQEAMKEGTNIVQNLNISDEPGDLSKKQSEIVEETMQKAFANAADMSDIVTKTQKETSKLITERFDAAMKELKDSVPGR